MVTLCACGCGEPAPIASKTNTAQGYVKGEPMRFVRGHAARLQPKTKLPRVCACGCGGMTSPGRRFINHHGNTKSPVEYVEQDMGYTTPCWVWQRFINGDGYGMKRYSPAGRTIVAHRAYYLDAFGSIPEGLTLDHLCRVRHCVNPEHLEPVTGRVNILRGEGMGAKYARRTHCPEGHPLSGDNLYVNPGNGSRNCRTCKAAKRKAA